MVWFSQVVGLDRGLEPFLRGMSLAADIPLELTIIGQCPPDVKNELQSNRTAHKHTIHFKEPMNERNLFAYLQNMEIGLALEPGFSQNNLLARSNKIYNYVVAGCFTVFSSTPAQVDFLRTYPTTGIEVNLNSPESVQSALTIIWSHRKKLLERRMSIWSLGQNQLNWDKESRVLLNAVREYLHSK